jgi:hypothetical protein
MEHDKEHDRIFSLIPNEIKKFWLNLLKDKEEISVGCDNECSDLDKNRFAIYLDKGSRLQILCRGAVNSTKILESEYLHEGKFFRKKNFFLCLN